MENPALKLPFRAPFTDLLPLGRKAPTGDGHPLLEIHIDRARAQLPLIASNVQGMPLTAIEQQGRLAARDYERWVYEKGQLPLRPGSVHDLLNLCMWSLWPQTKSALNALQVERGLEPKSRQRSAVGNAGTLFDECGLVLVCSSLGQLKTTEAIIRQHQWQALFIDNRELWGQQLQPLALGHGMLEQMLRPFDGLMGKCVLLPAAGTEGSGPSSTLDHRLSGWVQQLRQPRELLALPVLGIPGWHRPNENPDYYANRRYFQPLTAPKPPSPETVEQ